MKSCTPLRCSGTQLRHLAPPAQVLNGLSVHQSWAWEVCCLTFVHPCLAEKSLHIGRLCIQSLNACPDSPVVPHASTHTCTDNTGPWEPSLRHPQMPVSVLLHASCPQPSVSSKRNGASSAPTVTSTQTWVVCARFTAPALSCVCVSVCTGRESIHPVYNQESMHVCPHVRLHTDTPVQTPVASEAWGWLAEVVLWSSFPA